MGSLVTSLRGVFGGEGGIVLCFKLTSSGSDCYRFFIAKGHLINHGSSLFFSQPRPSSRVDNGGPQCFMFMANEGNVYTGLRYRDFSGQRPVPSEIAMFQNSPCDMAISQGSPARWRFLWAALRYTDVSGQPCGMTISQGSPAI